MALPDDDAQQKLIADLQRRVLALENAAPYTGVTSAPTNTERELDVPFVIGNDSPTLVIYSLAMQVQAGLLSAQTVEVLLKHGLGSADTIVDRAILEGEQLLGLVSVGQRTKASDRLVAVIPAGHTVQIVTSGSGTVSLIKCTEQVLR